MSTETAPASIDWAHDGAFVVTAAFHEHVQARLEQCARRMLRQFPIIRRWDETDDVLQTAALRFHKTLLKSSPVSEGAFFAMAAKQIRWTLIDLAKKYRGPESFAANYETSDGCEEVYQVAVSDGIVVDETPASLSEWTEFHERAATLPDEVRSTFELLYYCGVTQHTAARLLGLSERSVRRRFREAKLLLADCCVV